MVGAKFTILIPTHSQLESVVYDLAVVGVTKKIAQDFHLFQISVDL
jgi:hypothetical protein